MAKAIALEQFLRIALMEHQVRKTTRSSAGVNNRQFSDRLLGMTFGTLRQQVYQKYKLTTEFLDVMQTAKDQRDYLAHNFWIHHLGNLRSQRGLNIIVRHCRTMDRQIDGVADYLIQQTGIDAWRYIGFVDTQSSNAHEHDNWEQLLDASERSLDAWQGKSEQ